MFIQPFFESTHQKYGYNPTEMIGMVFITAFTNLACLPAMVVIYKQKFYLPFYVSVFTVVTSFLYHFLDSLPSTILLVDEGAWHRLGTFHLISNEVDNIGAHTCFVLFFTQISHYRDYRINYYINYSIFFLVLIFQQGQPWNLTYTVIPILLSLSINLITVTYIRFVKKSPNAFIPYNRQIVNEILTNMKMFKVPITMFIALFFFIQGLDEMNDYLRFKHGCWHITVGISSFYTWQTQLPENKTFYFKNLKIKQE